MSRGEIKESAGTIRTHQETQDLHPLEGPKERPGGSLWGPQGPLKYRGGGLTAVEPPPAGNFWIPRAPWAMLLGTSDSCWAVHGAPWGALGHLSGRLGGNGGPPGDVWKLPERVQSHLKMIEKPLVFIAFLSIEVIWKFSGGGLGSLRGFSRGHCRRRRRSRGGPRRIFSVLAKDRKGSTAVDL